MQGHQLAIAGGAAGAAAAVCCVLSRRRRADDDEDFAIPTEKEVVALKRTGMSDEQIQREEQLVKLPKRPTNRCEPPAGCIIRGDKTLGTKTYCPAVPEWNVRKPEAYPQPAAAPMNPLELWEKPKLHEYEKTARDGHRWAWQNFIVLDDHLQLVSTQNEYVSEEYGVRIILTPTLRLADAQFFESIAHEVIDEKAFVLLETLHSDYSEEAMRQMEREMNSSPIPRYQSNPLVFKQAQMAALSRRGSSGVPNKVGGGCVVLDYLCALIESQAHWRMGDPGLSDAEMANIQATVNSPISFRPLCHVREAYLLKMVDDLLAAAGSTEAWKEATWQDRDGEKVILLPWNGRHCDRIERFLVRCRGFVPQPAKRKTRIIFDPSQVRNMVATALTEDVNEPEHNLTMTPLPKVAPAPIPPPHNFGQYAKLESLDRLRELVSSGEIDNGYLEVLIAAGAEAEKEELLDAAVEELANGAAADEKDGAAGEQVDGAPTADEQQPNGTASGEVTAKVEGSKRGETPPCARANGEQKENGGDDGEEEVEEFEEFEEYEEFEEEEPSVL